MIRRRYTKVNNATQFANRRPPIPTLVLRPPLFAEAEAVDPVAAAVPDWLLKLAPVMDAAAVVGIVEGVMLGPGPAVTMSPFPPGYV